MAETPAELAAVAFPTLSEAELADIAECPELDVRRFRDGERIFQCGDADVPFFIVISGRIEIVDETGGEPKTHRRASPRPVHGRGRLADRRAGPRHRRRARRHGGLGLLARRTARAPQRLAGHGRHDPHGAHRAPADAPRIRRVHGPAGHRVAVLEGHVPDPRFPVAQPPPLHVSGHRGGPGGRERPRALRPDARRTRRSSRSAAAAPPQSRQRRDRPAIGIKKPLEKIVYDLAVVGGGRAASPRRSTRRAKV